MSEKLTTQLFQRRELIDKYFPTDADLEAMILDFFPDVHQKFATGMCRKTRVSLLFNSVPAPKIFEAINNVKMLETVDEEKIISGRYFLVLDKKLHKFEKEKEEKTKDT